MPTQVERLKQLPQRDGECWQGGILELPVWADDTAEPYRPVAPMWISVEATRVHSGTPCPPDEASPAMALEALVEFACDEQEGGYRPAAIEVKDADLARYLAEHLAGTDIDITATPHLEGIETVIESFRELKTGMGIPGLIAGKGVDLDRVRAFADAARRFHDAAPWKLLHGTDVIHVESPKVPKPLSHIVVGATGEMPGLWTCSDLRAFWKCIDTAQGQQLNSNGWTIMLLGLPVLPFADAELWREHDLPVAGPSAYPFVCKLSSRKMRRPDGETLAVLTDLLLALAETTEPQYDSGRWSIEVRPGVDGGGDGDGDGVAVDGDGGMSGPTRRYTFALPLLLEPPTPRQLAKAGMVDRRAAEWCMALLARHVQEQAAGSLAQADQDALNELMNRPPEEIAAAYPPRTPVERAQDLCYKAFTTIGRRRVALAREALEICPDCADAYTILAERNNDAREAGELLDKAIEAGRRALGVSGTQVKDLDWWKDIATRPLMRAHQARAETLMVMERFKDAAEHYRLLLRMDPDDIIGARQTLLPCLVRLGRDDEALRLLDQQEAQGVTATFVFAAALLAYRRVGDTSDAREVLREAIEANRFAARVFAAGDDAEMLLEAELSFDDEHDEALMIIDDLGEAWRQTRGATAWVTRVLAGKPVEGKTRGPSRQGKKRKKRSR